jgi:hypothetical protein
LIGGDYLIFLKMKNGRAKESFSIKATKEIKKKLNY